MRLNLRLNCLVLLAAFTFRLSGQTAAISNSDSIEFIQRAPQSTQAAEELEGSLKENPDNRVGHIRLMGYYWAQSTFFNRADVRHKLLDQAEWFVTNDPQSAVFDLSDFNLKATDFPARSSPELARYREEWSAAVQANPDDTVVLLHAIRALEAVDTTTPIYCYKRLRVLMPTYPQFALRLANGYMKMINAQWPTNGDKSPAMADLIKSSDSAVIGLTGQLIYAQSRLNGDTPEPIGALGVALLKRAQELDPGNRRWPDALRAPAPSGISSVVAAVGTMKQEDLWAGGKVKGIEAKEGTLTVAPASQAAKLVSPSPSLISRSLSGSIGPGEVQLTALIGPDGQVQELQFDSGSVRHLPAAMGMVKDWQYAPTMVDGKPVSVLTHVDLTYTAAGAKKAAAGDVAKASAKDDVKVSGKPVSNASAAATKEVKSDVAKSGTGTGDVLKSASVAATSEAVTVPSPVVAAASKSVVEPSAKVDAKVVTKSTAETVVADSNKASKKGDAAKDVVSRAETKTVSDFKMAAKDSAKVVPASETVVDRSLKTTPVATVQRPAAVTESLTAANVSAASIGEPKKDVVYLSVLISKEGNVKDVRFIAGPAKLRQTAIKEVKGRGYPPYLVNGEPVEVDSTAKVRFPAGTAPAVDLTFVGPAALRAAAVEVAAKDDAATHSSKTAAPKVAQLSPEALDSLIVSSSPSVHPQVSKAIRKEAVVFLKILVSTSGSVKDVTVISGPGSLRQAAIDEVKGRTYRPYAVQGQSVEVQSTTSVSFDPAAGQRRDSAATSSQNDGIILSQR